MRRKQQQQPILSRPSRNILTIVNSEKKFRRKSHDGHSKIQERSIRRKQQQQLLKSTDPDQKLCPRIQICIFNWLTPGVATRNTKAFLLIIK